MARLADRKERDRTGLFYAEGVRFVSEALTCGNVIETLVVCPPLLKSPHGQKVVRRLKERGTPCLDITVEIYESLTLTGDGQGIGAVVNQRWETAEQSRTARGKPPCWIGMETINSCGNFGMLLRTCEAVGATGALLLGPSIDPYDPTTVRATMGAHFNLRFARMGYVAFRAWKRKTGAQVIGTSPHAKQDYRAASYCGPTVLFLGSEQKGMTPEQMALCDAMVRIPMVGRSDSLNVGVAASLVLYEVFHQRHSAPIGRV